MAKNFNFKKPTTPPPTQGAASAELAKMLGVPSANTDSSIRQIHMLNIALLDMHPLQSHYSMNEEELNWLTENIRQYGVMEPIHVQKKNDGRYTIIAGHRRTEASRRAGLFEIPAILEQLDEDSAIIMFDSTNLGQRTLSPSERAAAYLRIEKAAANKQLDQNKTTAVISEITGDHVRTIHRYKRLNHLTPELLSNVDDGTITFRTGVELSYLSEQEQKNVVDSLSRHNTISINENKARALKEKSRQAPLTEEEIESTLFPAKKPTEKMVKIPLSELEQYLPSDLNKQELIEYIIQAVQLRAQNEERL